MRETLVFRMPGRDLQLAALCVLQEYERLKARDASWSGDFFVLGVDEDVRRFFKSQVALRVNWILNEEPVSPMTLYFDFNEERAYRLSKTQRFHVVRTFGIMLGCDPPSVFPHLDREHIPHPSTDLDFAVIQCGMWPVGPFVEHVSKFASVEIVNGELSQLNHVMQAKVVVGPTSLLSYAAASLEKMVVEVYPDEKFHIGWLPKFNGKRYHLVRETVLKRNSALLSNIAEILWRTT